MRSRLGLAVTLCAALMAFSISPAKALLVDGSYSILLTGELIDPSPGSFDVVGGAIQNFTLELLRGGNPPDSLSTYSSDPNLVTVAGGSMFSGTIKNDNYFGTDNDTILFATDNTWVCTFSDGDLCATSGGDLSQGDGGQYTISGPSVSAVPLPAAVWMFLSALAGLGLFGYRRRSAA